MKIYNRKDFMELPAGVVFVKHNEPTGISVKGDTLTNQQGENTDWIATDYSDYICSYANNPNDAEDLVDVMSSDDDKSSVALKPGCGRDGCFSNDDLFIVYEPDDIRLIAEALQNALSIKV